MDDRFRQSLKSFIHFKSHRLDNLEPWDLENWLRTRNICSESQPEIFLLVQALKQNIPADLLKVSDGSEPTLIPRLAKQLENDLGLKEEAARWAVESWAAALLIDLLHKPIPMPTIIPELTEELPSFLEDMIKKIEKCVDFSTLCHLIKHLTDTNEKFVEYHNLLHLYEGYMIQLADRLRGDGYAKTLTLLGELHINIAPHLIRTVSACMDWLFLISKLPGCKSGKPIPYREGHQLLSDEAKQEAYQELLKLTNAGYVEERILERAGAWFVTPDEPHKVVFPDWTALRKIETDENNDEILYGYRKILFDFG